MVDTVFSTIFGLVIIVASLGMSMWFFSAVGSAFENEEKPYAVGLGGAAWGAIFGLVAGIAFFVYFFTLL